MKFIIKNYWYRRKKEAMRGQFANKLVEAGRRKYSFGGDFRLQRDKRPRQKRESPEGEF